MAIRYGFFNSVDGDRLYNADDCASYFATFISNGVFPDPATQLQVMASGAGMGLEVLPGNAFINGYRFAVVDKAYPLTIPEAHPSLTRIDRVVVRWSRAARRIALDIVQGEPGAGQAQPVRQDYDCWELSLATVTVGQSVLSITQAEVQDTRGSADCGLVAWMVDSDGVDYAAFWTQMQTKFDDWVESCIAQTQGESTALANLGIQLAALCPQTLSGTFPAQSWTDDGSVYTQSLPPTALQIVTGSEAVTLEESTEAYIDLDMREATAEDGISLQDTWALVGRVSVDKAGVHAVCYGQAPAMDLPFLLRVVKKR